jgi:hypothetical protein
MTTAQQERVQNQPNQCDDEKPRLFIVYIIIIIIIIVMAF